MLSCLVHYICAGSVKVLRAEMRLACNSIEARNRTCALIGCTHPMSKACAQVVLPLARKACIAIRFDHYTDADKQLSVIAVPMQYLPLFAGLDKCKALPCVYRHRQKTHLRGLEVLDTFQLCCLLQSTIQT